LREETFSCGGQTNTVQIYLHEKTGLEFVLIPGGSFQKHSKTNDSEEPVVHTVKIEPYLICRTECTQRAWMKIIGASPWKGQDCVKEGEDYPATYVSWDDCESFCNKAGLRLPTDNEWFFACRAGSCGNTQRELMEYAWFMVNTVTLEKEHPHCVAQKKPNGLGLFDIHGNVWEWCGKLTGSSDVFYRGGSYQTLARFCSPEMRFVNYSDHSSNDLGFRPACSLPSAK